MRWQTAERAGESPAITLDLLAAPDATAGVTHAILVQWEAVERGRTSLLSGEGINLGPEPMVVCLLAFAGKT